MNAPADIKAATKLLTFDEWFAKWEGSDEHVELIDGEEVFLPSDGALHSVFLTNTLVVMVNALRAAGLWDAFRAYSTPTLKLSDDTGVSPDIGVFRAGVLESATLGSCETVVLAIETSDSTLSYDQGRKTAAYARYGVQELWIKRVKTRDVRVRRTAQDGVYVGDDIYRAGQVLHPLFAPQLAIAVDDLFEV